MCPPSHFAVTYSINPWMDPQAWDGEREALHAEATRQWSALHDALGKAGAAIEMVPHFLGAGRLAVEVQREFVFGIVRHDRKGLSATRSFFTARKTLCLAALVFRSNVFEISAIVRPS